MNKPSSFSKSRQVKKLMDIFLMRETAPYDKTAAYMASATLAHQVTIGTLEGTLSYDGSCVISVRGV